MAHLICFSGVVKVGYEILEIHPSDSHSNPRIVLAKALTVRVREILQPCLLSSSSLPPPSHSPSKLIPRKFSSQAISPQMPKFQTETPVNAIPVK